jgi:hypothetical protein
MVIIMDKLDRESWIGRGQRGWGGGDEEKEEVRVSESLSRGDER